MSECRTASDMPSLDELENLFVNNIDLETIRAALSRFNPIKTMEMERMEIRHSAILAWLLNPQETHGLGDTFLKGFLCQALRGSHGPAGRPSALDVSLADMMDSEVRREWRHIDLLVLNQRHGWIFVIENKFDSGQHSDQLKRYMDLVESTFMVGETFNAARGILLSLWDDPSQDERYVPLKYSDICEVLEQSAFSGSRTLTAEVETFLKHYLEVIQEAAGMSNELDERKALARQLYQAHRKVLDFIVKHGAGTGFTAAVEALTGRENPEAGFSFTVDSHVLRFGGYNQSLMSFLPMTWVKALGGEDTKWEGCNKFPLVCCFRLLPDSDGSSGTLRLTAEIASIANPGFRQALVHEISGIESELIKMPRGAENSSTGYKNFLGGSDIHIVDIWDDHEIQNKMTGLLGRFWPVSGEVASILPEFARYDVSRGKE